MFQGQHEACGDAALQYRTVHDGLKRSGKAGMHFRATYIQDDPTHSGLFTGSRRTKFIFATFKNSKYFQSQLYYKLWRIRKHKYSHGIYKGKNRVKLQISRSVISSSHTISVAI